MNNISEQPLTIKQIISPKPMDFFGLRSQSVRLASLSEMEGTKNKFWKEQPLECWEY
jgi:hypothetical protein